MLKALVAIVILAAGKASRMGEGGKHKLLAEFDGVPLVRRSALIALAADAASIVVVTDHRRSEIGAALDGLALTFINNPDYASGMARESITWCWNPMASVGTGLGDWTTC
jgi:molybdenum cofactor cytidylyltransferase